MAAYGDVHVLIEEAPPGDDDFQQQPPNVPVGGQQQHGGFQQQQANFVPWWMQTWGAPPPLLPQPPPQLQPHKVRLTDFWTHEPLIWFQHAEALFGTYSVIEERMKFNLVLPCLSKETLVRVAALVTNPQDLAMPYAALRARLLEVYLPDIWEQADKLLHYRELGDLKPSQLMDDMLAVLPAGEAPGILFKHIFLNRLPADVRAHVQGQAQVQECRQLAAAADVIWQARNQRQSATLAALMPVEEVGDAVAALSLQPGKNSGANTSRGGQRRGAGCGRGGNRPNRSTMQHAAQKQNYLCFRHAKFGDNAWECEDPTRCTASTSTSGN